MRKVDISFISFFIVIPILVILTVSIRYDHNTTVVSIITDNDITIITIVSIIITTNYID